MSVLSLLQQLQPIFPEDQRDWSKAQIALLKKHQVIWQASSGLDFTPILELHGRRLNGMHQAPEVLRRLYGHNSLFVFSEYSTRCLDSMKDLYDQLDDVDPMNLGFKTFSPCGASLFELITGRSRNSLECVEIIPLQLFAECNTLRHEYPNINSSVTTSAIPDNTWHAVYLDIVLTFRGQQLSQSILFFHIENLLCFEQVFVAHQIPIDIFYAKRVGGKSGSWDYLHSEDGQLMQSILTTENSLRPKIWAADEPQFTTNGEHIFGFANWYQSPWHQSRQEWHWITKQGQLRD